MLSDRESKVLKLIYRRKSLSCVVVAKRLHVDLNALTNMLCGNLAPYVKAVTPDGARYNDVVILPEGEAYYENRRRELITFRISIFAIIISALALVLSTISLLHSLRLI